MSVYAKETTVSPEKSRAEIEAILKRYGASKFMYGWQEGGAVIAFQAHGRNIRFMLPLPERVTRTPKGRSVRNVEQATEQVKRQKWRALALAIKAKLEMVESDIASFETEFEPYTLLPNGMTVSEWMQPQIKHAYESGEMPPLLLEGPK
jgi:hypothetical protein